MSGICVAEKSDAKPSYTSYLHGLRVIGGSKRHDFLPSLLHLYVAHLMARFARRKLSVRMQSVPAPPGVVMVSPPEAPRNAQSGKAKAALQEVGKARPAAV